MKREFVQFSKAWYAKHNRSEFEDEITLATYDDDGSDLSEFSIQWVWLNDRRVPQLHVFDDAWKALTNHFLDVLQLLSNLDNKNVTPDEMVSYLETLGIENTTETEPPSIRHTI